MTSSTSSQASAADLRNRPIRVRSAHVVFIVGLLLVSIHPAGAADRLKEPKFLPVEKLIADYGEALLPNNPVDETQKPPAPKRKARTTPVQRRFIAVRGLFPLLKEAEEYRRAIDTETLDDAAEMVQIIDFKIERQAVPEGKTESAEPWAELDINAALQILDAAGDLAEDVVDSVVIDNVMCMPLPVRASGKWSGDLVGHPVLKGLKPWSNPRADPKANERGNAGPRPGRKFGVGDPDPQPKMDYLLFRYLDFSVEPGVTYRYRVKLQLSNPNFEVEEGNPASKGETRWSAWSEASPAVKAAKAAAAKPAAPK